MSSQAKSVSDFIRQGLIIAFFVYLVIVTGYRVGRTQFTKLQERINLLQVVLCLVRNLSLVFEVSFPFNCQFITVAGFGIYSLWLIAMDLVLLLRSEMFITNKIFFRAWYGACVVCYCAINGFEISTLVIYGTEPICIYGANFSYSIILVVMRLVLHCSLMTPFIKGILQIYWQNQLNASSDEWARVMMYNFLGLLLLLIVQLATITCEQFPPLWPWLSAIYCGGNFLQCVIVMYLVDNVKDTVLKLRNNKAIRTKASKAAKTSKLGKDSKATRSQGASDQKQ